MGMFVYCVSPPLQEQEYPGANCEPLWDEKWFDIYRKIQDKHKNLVLLGGIHEGDMAGAERLIKSLDPTGLYLTYTTNSKDNADRMLEYVEKWTD